MNIRVLFVDDSVDSADITKQLLQKIAPEIEIVVSKNIDDALKLLKENKIDAVVSDYFLHDINGNGIDLFKLTREAGSQL
ncbi:MAG: response regulator, partial [Candidatus Thorarchaeota archaeon]